MIEALAPLSEPAVEDSDIELIISLTRQGDWSLHEIADVLELDPVLVIETLYHHRDCFFEDEDGSIH